MDLKLQIILILGCFVALLIFFNMLRKNKLYMKYSLVWLGTTVIILIFSIFPQLIEYFSKLVGVETPVNSMFLIGILSLGAIIFSLTVSQSRNSIKVTKIVQEFAILENELRRSRNKDKAE